MRITIKDIAERAGVSKTTVSFALNSPERISHATYERIMAIVNELGYVPDPVARTLTTKRLGVIGLLLPQSIQEAMLNPHLCDIIGGIGQACERYEISLAMLPPVKGRIIEAARRTFVDALLTVGVGPDHEVVEFLGKRHIPFVTIDGADSDAAVNVGIADSDAAYAVMKHMLDFGHRRIAIFSLMPDAVALPVKRFSIVRDLRLEGYARALAEAGLSMDSPGVCVAESGGSREGGKEAARRLLAAPDCSPTAIVAMSDIVALGVYDAASDLGIRIPEELSVAGFDGIPEGLLVRPALTTVIQSGRAKGEKAASLVLSILEGKEAKHYKMPHALEIRGSTAAVPEEHR